MTDNVFMDVSNSVGHHSSATNTGYFSMSLFSSIHLLLDLKFNNNNNLMYF